MLGTQPFASLAMHARLVIRLVSALDRHYPQDIVLHFENHAIVADAEAVIVGAREWFCKLQRIGLPRVETHLFRNSFPYLMRQPFKVILRRRRIEELHTLLEPEPLKDLFLRGSFSISYLFVSAGKVIR